MDPLIINDLIIPIAGMMTAVMLSVGFFRTVRHFIDRKAAGSLDADLTAEVADLRSRIDALEHRSERVDEIEDRLDFTERLLARKTESDQVARKQ